MSFLAEIGGEQVKGMTLASMPLRFFSSLLSLKIGLFE